MLEYAPENVQTLTLKKEASLVAGYWDTVEPIWDEINIDDPQVFLKTFRKVPSHAGLLYAAYFCQSEVCNGGFEQFFFNSTGVLAPEAVKGFHAIGQNKLGNLVQTAMELLRSPYPRRRATRQSLLKTVPAKSLAKLDERFFKLIEKEAGGFETAADNYAARTGGGNKNKTGQAGD